MRNFEYISETPLLPELATVVFAPFSITVAICSLLFSFKQFEPIYICAAIGFAVCVYTYKKLGATVISVTGYDLTYGHSSKIDLRGITEAKLFKQLGIEDVLSVRKKNKGELVSLRGVPLPVSNELLSVVQERIHGS